MRLSPGGHTTDYPYAGRGGANEAGQKGAGRSRVELQDGRAWRVEQGSLGEEGKSAGLKHLSRVLALSTLHHWRIHKTVTRSSKHVI